jgi:hypothetical protein
MIDEIEVEDLGVTLRTLLGIAGKRLEAGGPRKYRVIYKQALIGIVRVKPFVER